MSDNEVNEQENSESDKIDKFFALPQDIQDNLAMMFLMQEKLNDFTFLNNGITANDGSILTTQVFRQEVASAKFYPETTTLGPNTNAVKWMANYAEALFREVIELKDAIPWKWWSKSKAPIADIQEEIADAWHFLISETLAAGMTPNDIILAYCNKYNKNIERQKQAYVARGDVAA